MDLPQKMDTTVLSSLTRLFFARLRPRQLCIYSDGSFKHWSFGMGALETWDFRGPIGMQTACSAKSFGHARSSAFFGAFRASLSYVS